MHAMAISRDADAREKIAVPCNMLTGHLNPYEPCRPAGLLCNANGSVTLLFEFDCILAPSWHNQRSSSSALREQASPWRRRRVVEIFNVASHTPGHQIPKENKFTAIAPPRQDERPLRSRSSLLLLRMSAATRRDTYVYDIRAPTRALRGPVHDLGQSMRRLGHTRTYPAYSSRFACAARTRKRPATPASMRGCTNCAANEARNSEPKYQRARQRPGMMTSNASHNVEIHMETLSLSVRAVAQAARIAVDDV